MVNTYVGYKGIEDIGYKDGYVGIGYPAPTLPQTHNIESYSNMGNMFNNMFNNMFVGFFEYDAEHPAPLKKYEQSRNSKRSNYENGI